MMPMVYDTSCRTLRCYQGVIDDDLSFQFDHLAAGTALYPIVPTYARSSFHDPAVENVCTAAREIRHLIASDTLQVDGAGVWWYYGWNATAEADWKTCWLSTLAARKVAVTESLYGGKHDSNRG
jgi:hypothetical protein